MSDAPDEFADPAERRLRGHLELLAVQRPEPGRELVATVLRKARLQAAARRPLRVAGMIAASVLDGLGALFGVRRRQT